jgi:hypothetical protein
VRFIVAVLFAGLISASPLLAAEGDISLAGQVLLRIRYPAAGYTVAQRADAVQSRLNDTLTIPGVNAGDVAVKMVGKEAAIYVRNQLIITADSTTAKFNKTTPEKLAATWAANLRKALPLASHRERGG